MTAPTSAPNGVRANLAQQMDAERRRIVRERSQLVDRLRQLAALEVDLVAAAAALGVSTEPAPVEEGATA